MNVSDLFARLRELDIKVWLEGDQLKVNAPKGRLTPGLQAELAANKTEIKRFLQAAQAAPQAAPVVPAPPDAEVPLSPAQQRLWFLAQYDSDSLAYTIVKVYELNGALDAAALERSLSEIVRRHSALRTVFALNAERRPVQVVQPPAPLALAVDDLAGEPLAAREMQAHQRVNELVRTPFALTQGPLFRARLLRLDAQRHWLVVLFHHIICDGWSTNIFYYELQTLYQAFSRGEASPLPELDIQYADYAVWLHQEQTQRSLRAKLDCWLETLKGPLPVLELPGDYPRPALQTDHGANLRDVLPADLVGTLQKFSSRHKLTPFMIMLAAFQILVYRYTGQEDLIVGTPEANRPESQLEPLIGLFVNTLAIRTSLAGNPSGLELLERVRRVSLQAMANKDVPFEMVVEKLNPERDTSHTPVFQVFFTLQNAPGRAAGQGEVAFSVVNVDPKTAKFDLSLEVYVSGEQVFYNIEYNTDLFKAETVRRMLAHYRMLLRGLLDTPELPVGELPLLTEEERQRTLIAWNDTRRDYPLEKTFPALFMEQAQRTPEALAASDEEGSITYAELDRRSNRLAHYLMELGIRPEALVAVSLPRSVDMLVSLLGIMKAGGAYVPLDPGFPIERLKYMLADSEAPLLLTHTNLAARFEGVSCRVICLNEAAEELSRRSAAPPALRAGPDHLAYVMYTSGSTGRPKGVQVLMRGLTNFLLAMLERPGLSGRDVLLSVTSLSFDISGLELFLPLICGAQVVIVTNATAGDGARLRRALEQTGATVMQATPAAWRQLAAAGWKGGKDFKALCGGEPLPHDLRVDLLPRVGSLWNMYGPTETTIWSTARRISSMDEPVTVGRPVANTQVYLLDARGQPAPVGITGELYIGGEGVARGYLKRPELTAEKFVPDPFQPGRRLFRTGDLGRCLPDGRIEILGRQDDQIKLHGVRIELGEISNTLAAHPAVQSAVVVGRKEQEDNPYLAAYVVKEPHAQAQEDELRYYLSERLPTAMVPSRYVFLERLPLTPNGKVDKKSLPVPVGVSGGGGHTQPHNAIEAKLIQIWKDLLRVKQVGVQDNFFLLGGHSLLAVQMFNQIQEVFGVLLPLTSLFHQPNIAHLASLIYEHLGSIPWPSLVEIQPSGARPPFFCVHGMPGDVLWYGRLIPYMNPDQPLWGLESLGLDGIKAPLETIEEMAAHYIREMKSIQPEGPFYICGYSFGGSVAYEVARQLRSQGDTVGLLAIIDHASPKSDYHKFKFSASFFQNMALNLPYRLRDALRLRGDEVTRRIRRSVSILRNNFHGAYKRMDYMDWNVEELIIGASGLPEHIQTLIKLNFKAICTYEPRHYDGVLTLLRARGGPLFVSPDPNMGWNQFAGTVDARIIPGSHLALFREPNIRSLAAQLQRCLDEAQEREL